MGKHSDYQYRCRSRLLIVFLTVLVCGICFLGSLLREPANNMFYYERRSLQSDSIATAKKVYMDFAPPAIEDFMLTNRCPDSVRNRPSREIPQVDRHDKIFSDILNHYDGHNQLHHKQKFMGVRMGQFPFDLQVITEILYDIKPDLIIETGTNAGGSALYMAVMMAAINPACKILTVDTFPLTRWRDRFGGELPSDKEPWRERVTFMQRSSEHAAFLALAKDAAAAAQTVLVILDSLHEAKNVWTELFNLCLPLVSNNSYCIVEDTVLKTPMDALRNFWRTEESKDFCIDTDREYMGITQHRGGYLRRIDAKFKRELDIARKKRFSQTYQQNYVPGPPRDTFGNLARQRVAMDIATTAFIHGKGDASILLPIDPHLTMINSTH